MKCWIAPFVCLVLSVNSHSFLGQRAGEPISGAGAQGNGLRRFEAGLHVGDLHLGQAPNFCATGWCVTPQFTLGADFAFNVNQHFAIDSSWSMMPGNDPFPYGGWSDGVEEGGHSTTFFAGAKGAVRGRRWGLFAEARPGLLSWSHVVTGETLTQTTPTFDYGRRTFFALDLSGGVEYSASDRLHVHMSMGSALVRYNDAVPETDIKGDVYALCTSNGCTPWFTNLEANAGITWGFGKPMTFRPPDALQTPSHRFLDKTNVALLTISVLGQLSDGITTQRFIKRGTSEADPLYRPFVDQGWPGQIAAGVLDTGAQVSIMYVLHRMHHDRIERAIPLARGALGGIQGYRNDRME